MLSSQPVRIHDDATSSIHACAEQSRQRETGGLLLGWWETDAIVVRHAIEVSDPEATATSWTREEHRSTAALATALEQFEHPWLGYVGDWHTHPAPSGASSTDRRSIRRASRGYGHPLVLIVHRSDGLLDCRAARRGLPVRTSTEPFHTPSSEESL